MGGYYLCRTKRAVRPYYIESIGIHIYSIEELCYYFSENIYLIDETVMNGKLCNWLGEEIGLRRLQKILLRALEKGEEAASFVMPIFQECGYLTEPQMKLFKEQLHNIQIEPQDMRRKMKADYLVNYGMYVSAIEEYSRILDNRGPGRLGIHFYASVLESQAGAYARLFDFEEAARCLWESYATLHSKRVYEKYLRLLPLFMSERSYQDRLSEIKADRDEARRMKDDAQAILLEAQESRYAKEWEGRTMQEQIETLKKEYLRIG